MAESASGLAPVLVTYAVEMPDDSLALRQKWALADLDRLSDQEIRAILAYTLPGDFMSDQVAVLSIVPVHPDVTL